MLSNKQVNEIKEHLEKAQNPLFFYDNDVDGLSSFLILRRYLERGKGVAIRSYPDLNDSYSRKVQELNADYVFILDKAIISEDFIETISMMHIPIVWIDHHVKQVDFKKKYDNLFIYNNESGEPTSYMCYDITRRKEDLWIALMGCISDHYMPSFSKDFSEYYPDYWGKFKDPFDALYGSELGKIARALSFGLKDSITHVVQLQNYMINCKNPNEVFLEVVGNQAFRDKYKDTQSKFNSLIEKAKMNVDGNLLFFVYSGEMSMSGDISNYLCYLYPKKYIVVAFKNGYIANLSIRGKNVRKILEKILGKFESASGGGHEEAVGARIKVEDLDRFKKEFEDEIK